MEILKIQKNSQDLKFNEQIQILTVTSRAMHETTTKAQCSMNPCLFNHAPQSVRHIITNPPQIFIFYVAYY